MVSLVQCTKAHFAFDSSILGTVSNFEFDKGLCPAIGNELSVGGKPTSNLSSYFSVRITRCNQAATPGCVNDTIFSKVEAALGGDFFLVMPIINTQINPANSIYKSSFIEDRNAFNFNSQMGISATAYI